jgi:hypothetical protein
VRHGAAPNSASTGNSVRKSTEDSLPSLDRTVEGGLLLSPLTSMSVAGPHIPSSSATSPPKKSCAQRRRSQSLCRCRDRRSRPTFFHRRRRAIRRRPPTSTPRAGSAALSQRRHRRLKEHSGFTDANGWTSPAGANVELLTPPARVAPSLRGAQHGRSYKAPRISLSAGSADYFFQNLPTPSSTSNVFSPGL